MSRALVGAVLAAALLSGGAVAWGAGGDLLWTDRYDSGSSDGCYDVAAKGSRVYAVGIAVGDFVVRAYRAKTGELLWEDQHNEGGYDDAALAVALRGHRVFAAGRLRDASQNNIYSTVRAYDATKGSLLWHYDSPGAAYGVAVDGSVVVTAGGGFPNPGPVDFAVRAHDPVSGAVLWEDYFDQGGTYDEASRVVVTHNIVIGSGYSNDDYLVRAYDEHSGALLWQDLYDDAGFDDSAGSMAVRGDQLFVIGRVQSALNSFDFFVRSYDVKSGTILWEDRVDVGNEDLASGIAVKGRIVYVVGRLGDLVAHDFVVRAYDTKDGSLIWQDLYDVDYADAAEEIVIRGKTAYVVGWFVDALNIENAVTRAYNAKTGALLWQVQDDGGGDGNLSSDIALAGRRLIVGSLVGGNTADTDFGVRAYDSK